MNNYLNDSFATFLKELYQLKSVIPTDMFMHWFNEVQKTQSKLAIDSLRYYGHIWNAIKL